MKFYDNYIEMCNKIGKTPSAVALEIGLSKPTVNRWKNGSLPTDATLRKIAAYFGVQPDQMLGEMALEDLTLLISERDGLITPEQAALMKGEEKEKPAGQQANEHRDPLMEPEILFALFGNSDNITPEMMEDVKRFARYVQQEKERNKK